MSDTIQDWLAEQDRRRKVWLTRLEALNEERERCGLAPLASMWTDDPRPRPLPTPMPGPCMSGEPSPRFAREWRTALPFIIVAFFLLACGFAIGRWTSP